MIKREHVSWVLTACSFLMGATGAVTGINANARITNHISEPTSAQWKALKRYLGESSTYWCKTFMEAVSEKADEYGDMRTCYEGKYSAWTGNGNKYELNGYCIIGWDCDGKISWRYY